MGCKPFINSYDDSDRPAHLPAGLTIYELTHFAAELSPFHTAADDMESDPRMKRIELDTIWSHRFEGVWGVH